MLYEVFNESESRPDTPTHNGLSGNNGQGAQNSLLVGHNGSIIHTDTPYPHSSKLLVVGSIPCGGALRS